MSERSASTGGASAAGSAIAVFDSGLGGLSVLRALRSELPAERFVYFADSAFAPYGERGDAYVVERTRTVVRQLQQEHAIKALVVACNTATAAAIHLLREEQPGLPIVGVEPALKPALVLSRTRRIGVLATRGTLASAKFNALHGALAGQAEFACQPCDGLAEAIEQLPHNPDATEIIALCARHTGAIGPFGTESGQIDTVVLGCTHYPLVQDIVRQAVGPAVHLIDTGPPVAQQTRRVLQAAGLLAPPTTAGALELRSSGALPPLQAAAQRWLGA